MTVKIRIGDDIYCAKCKNNNGKIVKISWNEFAQAYRITCQCGASVYISATGRFNGAPIIKTTKAKDGLN